MDFLLGEHTAIEVKAKRAIGGRDLRSLHVFKGEGLVKRYLCVCLESRPRRVEGIDIVLLSRFLHSLWEGDYR